MPAPDHTAIALADAAPATVAAARAGADVIYQGTFFDGRFLGFCDFLVREGDRMSGVRHQTRPPVKVTALLQLAAYADALCGRQASPRRRRAHLLLGDGSDSRTPAGRHSSRCTARRDTARRILDERRRRAIPVQWGDPRYTACGACATCAPRSRRTETCCSSPGCGRARAQRLIGGGVTTIDALADRADPVTACARRTLDGPPAQAALADAPGALGRPRCSRSSTRRPSPALPQPDPGDIFFDFEGDPLWAEAGSHRSGGSSTCSAADRTHRRRPSARSGPTIPRRERRALLRFPRLRRRTPRRDHPAMHVYHYAAVREVGAAAARGPARRRRGGRRRPVAGGRARRPVPDRPRQHSGSARTSYSIK